MEVKRIALWDTVVDHPSWVQQMDVFLHNAHTYSSFGQMLFESWPRDLLKLSLSLVFMRRGVLPGNPSHLCKKKV